MMRLSIGVLLVAAGTTFGCSSDANDSPGKSGSGGSASGGSSYGGTSNGGNPTSAGTAAGGAAPVDPCQVDITINSPKSIQDNAGVNCARTLYVLNATLTTLEGLEHFTKVNSLIIGHTPSLSFTAVGNPALQSLKGLEGLTHADEIHIEANPKLTDLSGLTSITKNIGQIKIIDNATLPSLEGLHNLTEAGEIEISGNKLLADLKGLRGLTKAGSLTLSQQPLIKNFTGMDNVVNLGPQSSSIDSNDALEDFTGLGKLQSIGNSFSVIRNDALKSFNGLDSLKLLAWTVDVSYNPELTSVTALSHVNEIRSNVTFRDNPKLPTCQIQALAKAGGQTCTCMGNDDAAVCQ
jgi:hypothetical protein